MRVSPDLDAAIARAAAEGRITEYGRTRRPAKLIAAHWSVTLRLPVQVKSEANQRCHWTVRRKRFVDQREMLLYCWRESPIAFSYEQGEIVVTWTHIGPVMDSDNLAGAFKGLRDALAGLIGLDDGDERIEWRYEQRHPTDGRGVEVRIESR